MIIQISSGQGPDECELAVSKLFNALQKEFLDIKLIDERKGHKSGCRSSMTFSTETELSFLEGSVQWICQSPYRPHHKRKNWFVDVSILESQTLVKCSDRIEIRKRDISFESFHSGGNGGQNVNKVSTGVRLMHKPTGITVTSTSERTQYLNRQDALCKLMAILQKEQNNHIRQSINSAWKEHNRIIRGNPVRVYTGPEFILKKQKPFTYQVNEWVSYKVGSVE